MKLEYRVVFTWLLFLGLGGDFFVFPASSSESEQHFLNEWTAEIPGGHDVARRVAEQHGYTLVRELHHIPDHYILHRRDTPHRSKRSAHHHTRRLEEDNRVHFVQQQHAKIRVKRDVESRKVARAIVREAGGHLNDPMLVKEWYIADGEQESARSPSGIEHMGVKEAWKLGYTGKNISVSILDDGIERGHPDLADNYDEYASYDYNDNDHDPNPRYDITNENKHGTRCAGEIAMVANNGKCGVGVAFDSKIGGIRMLDGTVTDRLESEALCFNISHVDIFSSSWGPTDDGTHMEGPGTMAMKAILKGINEGRDGKGVLYAWASGNGGRYHDNCNADGYSSSIYTIAISSASQRGLSPWYSEKCASTLATAFSSGTRGEQKIISTDLHGKCTDQHSGTSAAAPMGAGLLALLLEANPDVTWRDVQHIIVHTSEKGPLASEKGWYSNAAGYCVNLEFGFGMMDAFSMVKLADPSTWQNVGPQRICQVVSVQNDSFPTAVSSGKYSEIEFVTDGCQGQESEVNFLEHVEVNLNLSYPERGRISAELESPQGTKVVMMLERERDKSTKGFVNWPLMSVHTWGENPDGTWKFRVMDKTDGDLAGKLKNATLTLYGTKEQPNHYKTHPKSCVEVESLSSEPEANDENAVENTLHNVKALLHSSKSDYMHTKLQELLKNGANGDVKKEVEKLLDSFGYYR